ncbi:MAG TPA: NAD(P)-dependent oxidoreductase [Opitutaceae bacterium]|jgi:3-hydroxyisobutyrate dehydrogenase-like beta-hydroxyacid dehydrogenase|nr:NAD(P)-dependent oxidoreductase [Opitutaceae bacterium]
MNKTIGVIGLGIIGGAWTRNYALDGLLAGCWNRTPQPQMPAWKNSPEEVVAAADVVQIVVADPPAVAAILEKILPRLGPGKIVVQSSTIDPSSSEKFSAQVTARGARYLEAPFTGSKPAAENRQTVFFLGGDAGLVAEVEPLLSRISAYRFHIGTGVQAASVKLALNLNILAQMEGLAEALTIARRAGVGDDMFFRVLEKNVAYSALAKLKEPKLRAGDFSPQFSVKHMHKDMRLATAMNAGQAGAGQLPLLEALRERLRQVEERGGADEDFSALIKLL